ncbi:MAG: pyridoxal-phosphate dependent enzyme [Candidatus Aminicenantes bacterium]|nr:pyridoxal-phosphate dependent enzyme [Candidatus Aminicenantes bacterium]
MKKQKNKFNLICSNCDQEIDEFKEWFDSGQRCPQCGDNKADVVYSDRMDHIEDLLHDKDAYFSGLWRYFDYLPLNKKDNIVSCGEGIVPIDRWRFLEKFAKKNYNLRIKVFAHRHDDNFATGTFKDLAGSMIASVLKENNIQTYVTASTGNVGVAYARYLAAANITLYAFIPSNSSQAQEAEIGCFGQKVFRVNGDYQAAKEMALEFSKKNNILLAAGNFDPMRIEAKKTMVYEWLRLMLDFPTVYIQALSGGTGPLGIAKACNELKGMGFFEKMPRFILTQTDKCAPMANAWAEAKKKGFPEDWEKSFPIYHDPKTIIPTLATGYPKTYPFVSKLVHESGGEINDFPEVDTIPISRLIAYESAVRIGPAAAIAVGGFFRSLSDGLLKDDDVVIINVGEGIRRAPGFMSKLIYKTTRVNTLDDCGLMDRDQYRKRLWEDIIK